jgi:hypothetical protein
MNARLVSISLSVAAVVLVASTDALAQGRGMGGGMGGGGMGHGGMSGGGINNMPSGIERSMDRSATTGAAQERGRSGDAAQAPADQKQSRTPQDLLQQNPKLSDNLGKLLPAGTDVQAAASGFKNLGEFVAAVHVSNNLGIPFADLKTKLLAGDSLGSAIQTLKPEADAQVEARKARARADELTSG